MATSIPRIEPALTQSFGATAGADGAPAPDAAGFAQAQATAAADAAAGGAAGGGAVAGVLEQQVVQFMAIGLFPNLQQQASKQLKKNETTRRESFDELKKALDG